MSENIDPTRLKVVELRAELSSRGLDTKGNKAVLVDRLKEALEREAKQDARGTGAQDSARGQQVQDYKTDEAEMEQDSQQESGHQDYSQNSEIKKEHDDINQQENMDKKYDPNQHRYDAKPEIKRENIDGTTEVKMEVNENVEVKTELKQEPAEIKQEADANTTNSSNETKDQRKEPEERRGEKRRRSPSPPRRRSPPRRSPPRRMDDEPDYDENAVILGWYDSDLNLVIDKETFTSAAPMFDQGFGYIWAGARATYGFKTGRVLFEVKLTENCDVSHLEDEPSPHVLRVGWSTEDTSMQLGEEPLSYGYGGTGKASTDCKFKDYGKPFQVGDIVGAYADLSSNPIKLTFTVNGVSQGVAYEISRSQLGDKALFPHVLSKNTKFKCNFGAEAPWCQILPGYTFAGHVPLDQRVAGPKRPERREDCEMIMMCGLPGCGKTTWANEWYEKNVDKKYNILGTNNLIDKMKMMGLPRKRNYAGRWDVLIDKCTKCLVKLLEVASRRRRNYILDQTNVYPSAQRRKMRGFEGFIRRAVVIVPTDEEFKRRCEKREKVEGKDVPDSAVLEMKANFMLPEVGDIFSEVIYTELPESEARPLVEQYNKEGRDAGYGGQQKRFRNDNRNDSRGGQFRGGGGGGGGGFRRGGPDNRNRTGGWQPRGGGSGGGGGGSGGGGSGAGGWRDRNQSGGFRSGSGGSGGAGAGGGRMGGSGGSGGGSGGWSGGRGGGRGDSHSNRGGYDRNRSSSGNRNAPSGGKGNWGGYNQGSGGGGSGGSSGGGSSGNWGGSGSGSNWGGQGGGYNQQGWGQGNYQQQGWKGYGQQGGGGGSWGGQGGYQQQGYGGQQGYGNGNYPNWNQQYYNQPYGGSGGSGGGGAQGWGQGGGDGSYGGYPQQSSWQGYGQGNYNYGGSGAPPMQPPK